MFGYVKPESAELLVKEYEFYKATYCGICRAMKKYIGISAPATITYDSVFLALMRMLLVDDNDDLAAMRHIVRADNLVDGRTAVQIVKHELNDLVEPLGDHTNAALDIESENELIDHHSAEIRAEDTDHGDLRIVKEEG